MNKPDVNFAVLRRVSENHETGAVSWAGTYRGRPVGASLALIREKVIENGEKIGEDEVYSPELSRSDLIVRIPSARVTFTLQNAYSYLAADSKNPIKFPASETFEWGPATVGHSRLMVGIPPDLPSGALLLCAIRIEWAEKVEIDIESFLDSWASESLDELTNKGITVSGDDGDEPFEPGIAALHARQEANRVYYEDLIESVSRLSHETTSSLVEA